MRHVEPGMSKWRVPVEETAYPRGYTPCVTQMYPAEDEQAARALAERVAFEYRPAMGDRAG